jgi:hypothetical protein
MIVLVSVHIHIIYAMHAQAHALGMACPRSLEILIYLMVVIDVEDQCSTTTKSATHPAFLQSPNCQ